MILFRNRVVTYIITVRIETRAHWIRVGPKSRESILIGDREGHTEATRKKAKLKLKQRLESHYYNPKKPG